MTVMRTYRISRPPLKLAGGEMTDVTMFGPSPVRYYVEGKPACDPFLLALDVYEQLGRPDRIDVRVTARWPAR